MDWGVRHGDGTMYPRIGADREKHLLEHGMRDEWNGMPAVVMETLQNPVAGCYRDGDDLIVVYADGEQRRFEDYFLNVQSEPASTVDLSDELALDEMARQSGEVIGLARSELGRLEEMFGALAEVTEGADVAANSELDEGESTGISPFAVAGSVVAFALTAEVVRGDDGQNAPSAKRSETPPLPTSVAESRLDAPLPEQPEVESPSSTDEDDEEGTTSSTPPEVPPPPSSVAESRREAPLSEQPEVESRSSTDEDGEEGTLSSTPPETPPPTTKSGEGDPPSGQPEVPVSQSTTGSGDETDSTTKSPEVPSPELMVGESGPSAPPSQPASMHQTSAADASSLRTLLANYESATEADFQAAGVTDLTTATLPTARTILGALERSERESLTLSQVQEIANIAGLVHNEYNRHSVSFVAPSEVGVVSAIFDDSDPADGVRILTLNIPMLSERYLDRTVEIDLNDEFRRVEVRMDSDSDGNWNRFEEYSYDSAGMLARLVEKLDYYDRGNVDYIWESQYDGQGRLQFYITDKRADGVLDWIYEYFYNDKDQVVRIEYDRSDDGVLERVDLLQYDEAGRRSRRETDFLNDGTVNSVHEFAYDEDGQLVYTLADTGIDGDKSGETDQDGTMDYLDFADWQTYEFAPTAEEAEAIGVIDKAINMAGRGGATTIDISDEVLSIFTGGDTENSIDVEGGSRHTVRLSGGIVATGEVSNDGYEYVEYQGSAGSLFIDPRITVELV